MQPRDTAGFVAAILNDWYMVRHYARGARLNFQRARRQQAIQKLGLTIREAFASSDDFEPLIAAVLDGGHPIDKPPF